MLFWIIILKPDKQFHVNDVVYMKNRVFQDNQKVLLIKQCILTVEWVRKTENLVDAIEENVSDGNGNETEDKLVVQLKYRNFFFCNNIG